MRLNMRRHWFFLAPLAMLGIALVIFIGGEIVKQLWNWLLPPLFGWREVTFWQGFGILALCRILFGGLGGHGSGSNVRRRVVDRLADRMGDRWDAMTPEERDRFRERIRQRCGFDPSTSESRGQ